jgi:hypothetical protein
MPKEYNNSIELETKKKSISLGKRSIAIGLKSFIIRRNIIPKRIKTLVIPIYEVPSQFRFSKEIKRLIQSLKIPLCEIKTLFQ